MKNARLISVVGLICVPTIALAGPDWVEGNRDAGSTVRTAQTIVGVGSLNSLTGSLGEGFGEPDYEDMYLIRITEAAEFSFTLLNAQFDASMWLFNVTRANEGLGLLGNLDSGFEDNRPMLTSFSNDGSGARVLNPGVYGLAIALQGRRPVSENGRIFSFGEDSTEISGPDGPGGLLPHTGWIGQGGFGVYSVAITGATFVEVPTPGVASLGLIALGAAVGRRRR